jgi:tetratricopeptide (TPR) repeat protein
MTDVLQHQIHRARGLHQQGLLADAEAAYDEILQREPYNVDVLHLAGILALQVGRPAQGVELIRRLLRLNDNDSGAHCSLAGGLRALRRHDEALASYDRAIALQPDFARAYSNRGVVLADMQRHEEAVASHDRAIALRPEFAEAHSNRGVVLAALLRHEEALASFDRAIALQPNNAAPHYNRAKLLADLRRLDEALTSYDHAIARQPAYVEAHYNRAKVLADLRRHAEALASYDRTIALKADHAEAHSNRGVVLLDLQRPEEALVSHDRAMVLKPDHPEIYSNRGYALAELRRCEEALASCERAIALRSDYADAFLNRGVILARLQRREEALTSFDRVLALQPNFALAYYNRGLVLADMQRHDEALANHDRAIAIQPDFAEAHWSQSHCFLTLGRFDQGWKLFEWRKKLHRPSGHRGYPRPLWLGQDSIVGKTLFIHWEQGFGDTIQFCRYARLAQAAGARVIMSVQDPLRRLISTLGRDISVIGGNEAPLEFDYHCPMMSLPLAFGTTLETIPPATLYLTADAAAVAGWRKRLAAWSNLRIGLCWAGNPRRDHPAAHAIDLRRSITRAHYAPLAGVAGTRFISLQKGEVATGDTEPCLWLHDWTNELSDFADTAALIEALDLVITVDTAVAHLAGALGKPVWVLNRFDACWRWLTERVDSPWYPSVRLWRQPEPANWDSLIADVAAALRDLASDKPVGGVG